MTAPLVFKYSQAPSGGRRPLHRQGARQSPPRGNPKRPRDIGGPTVEEQAEAKLLGNPVSRVRARAPDSGSADRWQLRLAGLSGLAGCAALVAGNVAGVMIHEQHDPISDTISDLAAGPHAWIQDAGLLLFAAGLLALGAGVLRWNPAGRRWTAAGWLLLAMAADVVVIAAHNEYGDRDSGRYVIHSYAVYLLAALFAATTAASAAPIGSAGRVWRRFGLGITAVWLVAGPPFFFIPTAWDGAYERGLALVVVGWTSALSALLIREAGRRGGGSTLSGRRGPGSALSGRPG